MADFKKNLKQKIKKQEKRTTLEKEIYDAGRIANIFTGLLIVLYSVVTARISTNLILPVLTSAIFLILVLQFIAAPISNKMITQSISDDLETFYDYETNVKERTKLMKELMACPAKIGLEVFLFFMIGGSLWLWFLHVTFNFEKENIIMILASVFLASYGGCVLRISQTQKVCSVHASKVVEKGILKSEVELHHSFGINSTIITTLHIFGPIILTNTFYFLIGWRGLVAYIPKELIMKQMIGVTIINIIFYTVLSNMVFKRMMTSVKTMKKTLEAMNNENLHKVTPAPTDLSNEFMYNVYLIAEILSLLQKILKESTKISMDVVGASNELSVISKETAVTSLEQSSGIKELLTAMEDSDTLAKNISEKINEVSIVAKRNTNDINDGFEILKENMSKIDEIQQANDVTVEGIKVLSEKISGISDIASIINSIADQTNIIAFNAELEASRAGEIGENFKLVADEIRRLTNNTIQSTNEIRERIVEIQHSSENLLLSSQNGSKKINDGSTIIKQLYNSFEDLRDSSQTTDSASEEIKKIIEQQTSSFEQIVVTLRQISQAAENFSVSTQTISQSAENLCTVSEQLKKIQAEEDTSQKDAFASESQQESQSVPLSDNWENSTNTVMETEANLDTSIETGTSALSEDDFFKANINSMENIGDSTYEEK